MNNKKKIKKNNISNALLNYYKKLRTILTIILIITLTIFNIYLYYIFNNITGFLFIEILIFVVVLSGHLISWIGVVSSPKHIGWNEEGINIISLRGKEEFVPWENVGSIKWVGDIDFLMKKIPDYVLRIEGKLNSFRYLEPKIAKELIDAWEKYGEGPDYRYIPPGGR